MISSSGSIGTWDLLAILKSEISFGIASKTYWTSCSEIDTRLLTYKCLLLRHEKEPLGLIIIVYRILYGHYSRKYPIFFVILQRYKHQNGTEEVHRRS